jgi:biotin synthase
MEKIFNKVINKTALTDKDFKKIINADLTNIFKVFYTTSKIKEHFRKNKIKLCSIINAKSGKCPEDCAFCAQSAYHNTGVKIFSLISPEKIFEKAKIMEKSGAHRFSIVTSGTSIKSKEDKNKIIKAVKLITENTNLKCCASLGIIDEDFMQQLKNAGMSGYHHNLETSESFFNNICSTHHYEDDIRTVKNAVKLGIYTCSGGILGLGESWEQRIEMAYTIKALNIDSIALNFLNPIPGTKMEDKPLLSPMDALKCIALFRLINPGKDITICGGREKTLRDYQSWIFMAGANGVMIGDYLTTKGRNMDRDIKMIKDMGLEIIKE